MPLSKIDSASLNSPITAVDLAYTGTLTGNGGIVNIGSGQVYKDASGTVGIGTSSPAAIGSYPTVDIKGTSGGGLRVGSATYQSYVYTDAAGMTIGTATADPVNFFTNGTQRARITSAGDVVINGTAQIQAGLFNLYVNPSLRNGISCAPTTNAGYDAARFFNSSTTQIGSISCTTSATSYVTSSDYRLKESIAPMTGALEKIAALNPVTYKWKATGEATNGFIAHELQAVVPECVVGEKDAVDADGNPQYQGIDTSFLVATLTAAIQEQQTLITALTARITALEAK